MKLHILEVSVLEQQYVTNMFFATLQYLFLLSYPVYLLLDQTLGIIIRCGYVMECDGMFHGLTPHVF